MTYLISYDFNELYGSESTEHDDQEATNYEIDDNDLDIAFTHEELMKAVFSQQSSKSPGMDNLVAELFKSTFDIISPFLLNLYNKIFQTGIYPQSWGEGIIIPIHKGRDIDERKNNRGVTLNNIMANIYSKLLVERLSKWAEKHNTLIDNEYGFQKGKSTVDCIFIVQ